MEKKYIGITGVTSFDEIGSISKIWEENRVYEFDLFLGFLVKRNQFTEIDHIDKVDNPRFVDINLLKDLTRAAQADGIKKVAHLCTMQLGEIYFFL